MSELPRADIPSRKTVERWIETYPELQYLNSLQIFCTLCKKCISGVRKSSVDRHMSSAAHEANTEGLGQKQFNKDLLNMLVQCNIPWKSVDSQPFRYFVENCLAGKYGNVKLPTESSIRKEYLPKESELVKDEIRKELENEFIWLSVDETTNASGEKVANIIVGALKENSPSRPYLIASKAMDVTNSIEIAELVKSSLQDLCTPVASQLPMNQREDKFLLFVTDGVAYMKSAGRILKASFPNLLHLTCIAHGLHRVAECVRNCYPTVDKLIANVKKIFLKSPHRQSLFKSMYPQLSLPPEPVITRWGTWLEAASYYFCYFEEVKAVVMALKSADAEAIATSQELLKCDNLYEDLKFIHSHFSRIHLAIRDLQADMGDSFNIVSAINIVFDLRQYVFIIPRCPAAEEVQRKLVKVLSGNPGFKTIHRITDLLTRKEVDFSEDGLVIPSLKHYHLFEFAPITSVDVERSFSIYKWIYAERRRRITPEHMEQIQLIHFNRK